jgi:hypothetical protein
VAILRPARTPKGTEVRTVIKHVTKRLRKHWPNTRIVWRGDGHYARVEEMERVESDGPDYIFGLAGNPVLDALMAETADNLRFHHAGSNQTKLRTYASFFYQAAAGIVPARWWRGWSARCSRTAKHQDLPARPSRLWRHEVNSRGSGTIIGTWC